ncbi:helix-turn-helix domain-containing protein [Terriglobus tenax]|uniref:helix-turn-helix domain-containing protein n=1 Tax=Terriglobus tenax TaxID=1111115 RepID=UPI0037DA3FB6
MALAASVEQIGTRDVVPTNTDVASRSDERGIKIPDRRPPTSASPDVLVQEPFVDAERAASFLSMRRKTLLELARRGRLPGHPVGSGQRRMWKFRISELDHWMSAAVNLCQRPGPCSRRVS